MQLDTSLSELLPSNLAALAGLESVLASSYNGEHFLTTSFNVVRSLLQLPLSQKSRAVLSRLRSNIAGHGAFPYPNSFSLNITLAGTLSKISSSAWSVPITLFSNKNFPPSVVLGENLLDSEAFFYGARQAAIKSGFKEFCNAIRDAGGGSQTAVKLESYLKANNGYCMCITDGDYRSPTYPKSAVSNACSSLVNGSNWPSFAMDFNARSIENILPLGIIEDAFGAATVPAAFHAYKSISNVDSDAARYLDVKAGLKFCSYKKIKAGSEQGIFWRAKLQKLNLTSKVEYYVANPPACVPENCTVCSIIDGVGSGTLKQVVLHFQKNTPHKVAERVDRNTTWYDIGVRIFHWTLADKPILI